MKRLLFVLIAVCFLFSGCLGLETTESQDFMVKKLSRIAGITFAMESPEEIEKALLYINYIKSLEDGNVKEAAVAIAVKYIYDKYGKTSKTIILVAEVLDLLKQVVPDTIVPGPVIPWDMKLLNIAVGGFEEGVNLAK